MQNYKKYPLTIENNTVIQPFDESIVPWERGVRKGGMMNKKVMTENLLDFKEVLDKHNVLFLLFAGCLLGAIREKDFISWDSDIDVICFNEWSRRDHEKMKKVKEDLIIKGFHAVDSNECPLHNDFFVRNGEKIEIWWFDKIDDEWVFGNTLRYKTEFFDTPKEIDFLGAQFKVPFDPEKWLELHYGKDWKTPNPQGEWLSQDPVEVERRNHPIEQIKVENVVKLSIIMTAYKKNETLPFVLSSLARQIIPCSYETIVLNDYLDNDGTKEICEKYEKKLNIRYLFIGKRNVEDNIIRRATVAAINIGVREAQGEIIIINSPEIYHAEDNNIVNILNLFPLESKIRYGKIITYPARVRDDSGVILEALKENKESKEKINLLNKLEGKFPFFLAFYKQDFMAIRGGDEDFVGNAWDDQDLTDRLILSGCKYMERDVEVIHLYHPRLAYNTPEIKEGWEYNKKLYDARKGTILRNEHREWGIL